MRVDARNANMLFIEAALLFCVALFAQWRIAYFTRSATRRWTGRLILAVLGAAIGYTLVRYSDRPLAENAALFMLGFSLVHVPAAIILALKGWRRERPS
jgi:hypothetical protein